MSFTEHSNFAGKLLQDRGAVASAQALPRQSVVADQIRVGMVFIEEGTLVPDSLMFESAPYSDGWRSVRNLNVYDLDRKIRSAGWTLFDLSHLNASGFGFDREKAVHSAVKRALAKTKSDNFNALEISQVAAKRFLGAVLRDRLRPDAACSGKYVFAARQRTCETEPSQIGLQPS